MQHNLPIQRFRLTCDNDHRAGTCFAEQLNLVTVGELEQNPLTRHFDVVNESRVG